MLLVQEAAKDPTSEAAKKVLQTVLLVLTFGARNNIMAGSLGDTTSLSHAMAMTKCYGLPSTMITVTPDDINSPTSLWLACKSISNVEFPAVADETFSLMS
jgi:hypothetical protein